MEITKIGDAMKVNEKAKSTADQHDKKRKLPAADVNKSKKAKTASIAKDDGVAVSQSEITAPNEASSLKALDAIDTRGAQAFGLALGGGKVGNAAGKVADVVGPSKTESSTSVGVVGGGSGDEKGGSVASGGHLTTQDFMGASILGASSGSFANMCNLSDISAAIEFLEKRLDIHVDRYELMLSFRVTDDPDIGDFGPLKDHLDVQQWEALRDQYYETIELLHEHKKFMKHAVRWQPKSNLPDLIRAGIPQRVKMTSEILVEYEEWGLLTEEFKASIGLMANWYDKQYIKTTIFWLAEQVAFMEHCPYFKQPRLEEHTSPYLRDAAGLLSALHDQSQYLRFEERFEEEKQKMVEAENSQATKTTTLASKIIEYEPVLGSKPSAAMKKTLRAIEPIEYEPVSGSKPIAAMKMTLPAIEPIEYEPVLGSKPITNTVASQPESGEGDDAYDPAIDYPPRSPSNSSDDAYDPAIDYPPASPTNVADDDYQPGRDYAEIDHMMAS